MASTGFIVEREGFTLFSNWVTHGRSVECGAATHCSAGTSMSSAMPSTTRYAANTVKRWFWM